VILVAMSTCVQHLSLLGSYDMRVICDPGEVPESIADKVVAAIDCLQSNGNMYTSTRATSSSETR